jgi:hypothetical protein
MRALKLQNQDSDYFDQLPVKTQSLVSELLTEAMQNNGHRLCVERDAEQIECRSRDGFIPFAHNLGGVEINSFTDLGYFWGGGYSVSHVEANSQIKKLIATSFEMHAESIFETYKDLLTAKKITVEQCNYHDMNDLAEKDSELLDIAHELENTEMDFLSGDENSIMFQIRFMYHGKADGKHTASVSCAVNTEGPYHRSHISWAPGVFCEGVKEIEIEWKSDAGLKKTLSATLKTLVSKVF